MASMAAIGHYSIYGELLQSPVDGPGFADGESVGGGENRALEDKIERLWG
jgi:hypothetical protein